MAPTNVPKEGTQFVVIKRKLLTTNNYKCKTNAITADHMAQNKVPKIIAIEQMILGLRQTKELKQRKKEIKGD